MAFDPDSFLGTQESTGFDPDAYLQEASAEKTEPDVDPEAPVYARGNSASSPIMGESGVSVEDRFRMGFGNEVGNLNYLKQKYGEANVVKNNLGILTVKGPDNKWRAVDANTGEAPDPWDLTSRLKEATSEVAENVGTAARVASGLVKIGGVAAAPVSFGASAGVGFAVGAATDVALTSFGRALGTYSGNWEDQAKDAVFEGALNVLGVSFEAATKPTLGYLAKTRYFSKLKEGLATLVDDNPRMLGGLFKWSTGGKISQEAIEQIAKSGDELDMIVKAKGNTGYQEFTDMLRRESSTEALKAAKILSNVQSTLGERLYNGIADDVVEGSFKASNADLIDPFLSNYAKDGLVTIMGKTTQETLELLEKQGGKLIQGQEWKLADKNSLLKFAQENEILAEGIRKAASGGEAYKELTNPLRAMINYRAFKAPTSSKESVLQLNKLRQDLKLVTGDARNSATSTAVQNFFAGAHKSLTEVLEKTLPESSVKRLREADAIYAQFKNTNSALLELGKKQGDASADTFVNAIFGKAMAGGRRRSAIQDAIDTARTYGINGAAEALEKSNQYILNRKAAAEFTAPIQRIMSAPQMIAAGTGAGIGSQEGLLPGVAATAGVVALTSPRVGYGLLKSQLKANALTRAGLQLAKDKASRSAVANQALRQLAPTYLRLQADKETTREALLNGQQDSR